ncbi:MAG: hypothetical protein COU98_01150 [Candidatus Staskawiczbacteria bacterium CG10_big_fil_rev_8_21_14_0_10_38_10]|uniref:Uncharacterized protein n=1 Tax=Candidatus Staskawiczbacteria bacterium CG10_big_fil_rev_8_21_14_0_10_38_10 TaxID=1974891 RepID=A0A2H9T1I3_9BACT|nr:MAG: hypothetical protein COU98_01150 [Candidatus Staskawiczbacteria bacterium CG10_big_fil_rev_8_21_14_0_10_38_10]
MNKYFNIIIIAVILAIVFLSQQPFFKKISQPLAVKLLEWWEFLKEKGEQLFQKVKNTFEKHIWERIKAEINKRTGIFKKEVVSEKEKIESEIQATLWQRIKNFFGERLLKFVK